MRDARPRRRRWQDGVVVAISAGCALCTIAVLASVLLAILVRGLPAISWHFLTGQIKLVGASGGVFFNLVGTLVLIAAAAAVCTPIAVGIAVTHQVYLSTDRARRRLALLLFTLNGVPSILFGIFGFIVFVKFFGWGLSWLSGGVLLALMILPTVTVALVERMRAVPTAYLEAAAGLGLTRSQIARSVLLPQSAGGLVTGLLLGLARAAGETAPIMFTATVFAGAAWPRGVRDSPVLSLPYHIFVLAQDSFNPAVGEKMWGAAVVLLGLVLLLSGFALPLRLRAREEARGA